MLNRSSLDRENLGAASHPILAPCLQVIRASRQVRIVESEISKVAAWMSAEELPWPDFRSPLIPSGDDRDTMDFIFLTAAINFAFTDFATGEVFRTNHGCSWRSDSDAMMGCLKEAFADGVAVLDGKWLREAQLEDLEAIFEGSIRMPLLEERLRIFKEIGTALSARWGGRFHRFLLSLAPAPSRLAPEEILPRLVHEFPSFSDFSLYHGIRVPFLKRAQLLLWQLHSRFREEGFFRLKQPSALTAFADYIVPMALRTLGVLVYAPGLDEAIEAGRLIPADSETEIEIRAASLWACHKLTEAINELRPREIQIIEPVLDARLWTHYHASHRRHHLTVTTDY